MASQDDYDPPAPSVPLNSGKLRRCFMCTNCSMLMLMPVTPITAGGWEFHCPVCMEKQWFAPVAVQPNSLFLILT